MMLIYDTLYPRKHTESSADEDSNQVAGNDNLGTVIKAETATLSSAPEERIMYQQPELEQSLPSGWMAKVIKISSSRDVFSET